MAHSLLQALFHRREVIFGHSAAEHLFLKHEIASIRGLKLNPHIAELAVAARLLFCDGPAPCISFG